MALLSFHCPLCHTTLRTTNPDLAGRTFQCPKCAGRFPMPSEVEREALAARLQSSPALEPAGETSPRPEDLGDLVTAKPRPRSRLVAASFLVGALLLVAGSGWGAYLAWDHFAGSSTNSGTGNEDPLAYLPQDSTLVLRVNLPDPQYIDGMIASRYDQFVRELGQSALFHDCKNAVGLEAADLFHELTYGVRLAMPYPEPDRARGPGRRHVTEFTLVIRSLKPFSQKRVARAFPGAVAQRMHERTFYRINEGNFHWLYMPSDRLIVLTRTGDLSAILQANGAHSSLAMNVEPLLLRMNESHFWMICQLDASPSDEVRQRLGALDAWSELLETGSVRAAAFWARAAEGGTWVRAGLLCSDYKSAETTVGAFAHRSNDLRLKEEVTKRMLRGWLPPRLVTPAHKLLVSEHCDHKGAVAIVSERTDLAVLADLIDLVPRELGLTRRTMPMPYPGDPGPPPLTGP